MSPRALGGVWVPGESVIDPWSAPLAYATQALANGGHLLRGATVQGGTLTGDDWILDTTRGPVAGRGGGQLRRQPRRPGGGDRPAQPVPHPARKGQFVVFDKSAHALVRAIILPVPDDRTKGVVITRTAFGNLLVGPTAEIRTTG